MSSSNASILLRPAPEACATGVIPVAHNSQARQSCTPYPRQSTTMATGKRLTSYSEVSTLRRLRKRHNKQQPGSDVSSAKTTKDTISLVS